ncbi:DUF2905 domain-containing protein [Undibacterium arcticum]
MSSLSLDFSWWLPVSGGLGCQRFRLVDCRGDIHIVREGFSFHFPIVTCIVISLVLSILFWIFRR